MQHACINQPKLPCHCCRLSAAFNRGFNCIYQQAGLEADSYTACAGGLCPVAVPGIENINLTSIIAGHFDYIRKMDEIMELVSLYG